MPKALRICQVRANRGLATSDANFFMALAFMSARKLEIDEALSVTKGHLLYDSQACNEARMFDYRQASSKHLHMTMLSLANSLSVPCPSPMLSPFRWRHSIRLCFCRHAFSMSQMQPIKRLW